MVASWTLGRILVNETLTRAGAEREPEPAMVMAESDQVADYDAAGRDGGAMTPTHLLHSAQAASLIRTGDRVLDLGCGPGTQLVQLASLRPEASFVGLDLSEPMLDIARRQAQQRCVDNVDWQVADITSLGGLADESFDVVVSSMTLHHLPGTCELRRCMSEARRVLVRGGRIYLADFARLRSAHSMRALAYMHEAEQPVAFTRDFHNSLRAAFSGQQWQHAAEATDLIGKADAQHALSWPIGLMQVLQSRCDEPLDVELAGLLRERRDGLTRGAASDLRALMGLMRHAGVRVVLDEI